MNIELNNPDLTIRLDDMPTTDDMTAFAKLLDDGFTRMINDAQNAIQFDIGGGLIKLWID